MKKFLVILILVLGLQTSSQADDIRDFEIEGMSIGDSLLNFFNKREIKENITDYFDDSKLKKYYSVEIYKHERFEVYDSVQISLKINDKDYIIDHIVGLIFYENNINACYLKQKEIAKELTLLFENTKKSEMDTIHPVDVSGNTKLKEINFWFKSGDVAGADCYDWSDKMSYADHLRVGMLSNEFNTWLNNEQQ